ncbi:Dystrophin isoforms A/C/F/G/H [Fasciola gigantica]|uniref:Dystrophin isoforms A/C/F/G/H n=1 Tax=Fasciola gigantica TaxID=46835 RepID=A0A504YIG9_FASGI|nr:Dystrophin isoforms A/C/F/G/H [Fasciola gigantica]
MQPHLPPLSEAFTEIEERLDRVVATKQAFRIQIEQVDQASDETRLYESHVAVQAQKSPSERGTAAGLKPSVNETIELLINPDTPVSPTVRELAREIRDHFRGVVLFNRFCLGTNAPLPTSETLSDSANKSYLLTKKQYDTTIAERKAIVKHFRQQRTHLGDRLRELIVNAGDGETSDRLQDLLSLQMVWHETNEKLDRRGEQMALLEQQLTTAELAIADYMKIPTQSQGIHCTRLLNHLEETYGWILRADHERIRRRADGQLSITTSRAAVAETEPVWSFNENLLSKYENDLKTVSRFLNEIQADLDVCKSGSFDELRPLLEKMESKFIESYKLLSSAAESLNELTLGSGQSRLHPATITEAQRTNTSELNTEELVWLKVLLDTQKSRIDIYSAEFKANREKWLVQSNRWIQFRNDLELLKESIARINAIKTSTGHASPPDVRKQLRMACNQFASLSEIGSTIIQMDSAQNQQMGREMLPSVSIYPMTNEIVSPKSPTSSTDLTTPPAVPPRKNSLHRGRALVPGEPDRDTILIELNTVRNSLQELCRHLQCPVEWLSEQPEPTEPIHADVYHQVHGARTTPNRSEVSQSSYVNVNWPDDLTPSALQSALDSLGSYKADVEMCLRGLAQENRWFAEESGLVPTGLFKRKSDDILLTSAASRSKPTTAAELRLDNRFWLGLSPSEDSPTSHGTIEFTPSWLKSKWAELEALIETTFEHEKQSNNWCRKAAQLVKIIREHDFQRHGEAPEARIITRLESGCTSLREALNHAQQALKRRKTNLTKWQSDLVELDTLLAEIKALLRSTAVFSAEIRAENPSVWLSKLRHQIQDLPQDGAAMNSREHWLSEFNPRNGGLGTYLEKLVERWDQIQEGLNSPENTSIVRIPEQLDTQIIAIREQWDKLKKMLNVRSIKGWSVTNQDVREQRDNKAPPFTNATSVKSAAGTWPAHHPSSLPTGGATGMKSGRGGSGGQLNQTTSPTMARIRHEIEQLSRWLTSINYFIEMSRVRLGDRFDQDTVNEQLQQAKLATSEGSQMNIRQVYHPAALQLKIQQFLTEMEARKPQLDRINVEKERLVAWDSEEALNGDFANQVDNLPQLWDTAQRQMNQRSTELDVMINGTQRLKELEREIDRWINKAESELDLIDHTGETKTDGAKQFPKRFLKGLDANKRKRLQELSECLTGPAKEAWGQYRKDAEALMKRFKQEDNSKIQADMDHFSQRWNEIHERLLLLNQWTSSQTDYRLESPGPDADRIVLTKLSRTPNLETNLQESGLVERLDHVERRLNQLGSLDSDLQCQVAGPSEKVPMTERRGHILTELQTLQAELNTISTQMGSSARQSSNDLNSITDGELLQRWRQLRDRITNFRQSLQISQSQHGLFLFKLKQLNSWVSHRDAAFRAIICPLHGDLLFIMKMRELMLNLFRELEMQRAEVEIALHQGRIQYGEERVENNNIESEVESDSSELGVHNALVRSAETDGPSGSSVPSAQDEQTKRVLRRIRRYLYHLKKRWTVLNSNMMDYKQQLDSLSESFYEACEPLTVLLSNLDRQLVQFRDSAVIIDPGVITQQTTLRNDFEQVRIITESRIHAINHALSSIRSQAQRAPTLARVPSHRQTATGSVRTPVPDSTQASLVISPPIVDPQVPLSGKSIDFL